MIKLSVLYPNTEDIKFDKEYYINKHSQLLTELMGDAIISIDVNFGLSGAAPASPAPFVVITNVVFESMETFQQSFGVHSAGILADLPNFTNVKPQVQISEVL